MLAPLRASQGFSAPAAELAANSEAERTVVTHFEGHSLQAGSRLSQILLGRFLKTQLNVAYALCFLYQDMTGYLPNDILTKVDRASMHVGLEARVPLLDHRVVEFAWQVPLASKIRDGQGKYLLRQVLAKYLPLDAFARPKSGFSIPMAQWLKGPLKSWASDLLLGGDLESGGIFQREPLFRAWNEHIAGTHDHSQHLWNALVLQDWLKCHAGPS